MDVAPEAEAPERIQPRPRRGGRLGGMVAALSLVLVIALWGITAAGREWSAPPATLSAAVTFLPYLYASGLAFVFLAWCAFPDRPSLPVLLGTLAVTGGALWGPGLRRDADLEPGTPLKVMSWNVRRLWGGPGSVGAPEDVAAATQCVAQAIALEEPDVLSLLEVSRRDLDALTAELDLACVHSDYWGSDDPDRGGLATCVRGDRWQLRGGSARRFVDAESWTYVLAEIEGQGKLFNFLAVHLHPYGFSADRLREGAAELAKGEPEKLFELARSGEAIFRAQGNQSAALLEHVARFHDPTVVAGDFNSTPDTALHVALRDHLVDAWARGGRGFGGTVHFLDRLPLRVDYVYVSDAFAVHGATVPATACSDHLPVVAELTLKQGLDVEGDGVKPIPGEKDAGTAP